MIQTIGESHLQQAIHGNSRSSRAEWDLMGKSAEPKLIELIDYFAIIGIP